MLAKNKGKVHITKILTRHR